MRTFRDTLREQHGEPETLNRVVSLSRSNLMVACPSPDAESLGRSSHLTSTVQLKSLVGRPARQSEQATAVADYPN
jgi:hypothetical protein